MSIWVVKIVNPEIKKGIAFLVEADTWEELRTKFDNTYFSKIGLEIEEVHRISDWISVETLTNFKT